jgi:hypothetical protein
MWKDTTTYSQRDTKRTPTGYTLNTGSMRITVTCGHIDYKGQWIMHCPQLGLHCEDLASSTVEEAKASAIHICKQTLEEMRNSLDDA